ncbi:GNAT family N-acetyltransferase [Levilactobacillus bambusae]|nr:GNAT family N-acetyltransferase [Levilactobacillus bambusae]
MKSQPLRTTLLHFTELETDRLILRPVTISERDVADFYQFASDPETVQYSFLPYPSQEPVLRMISSYFVDDPAGKWGVELKATHQLIGYVELQVDDYNVSGEIGYLINRDFWHQGYASEAAQCVLDLGMNELKLVRVQGRYDVRNAASGRVLQHVGMQEEGVLRNHRYFQGDFVDDVIWSKVQ